MMTVRLLLAAGTMAAVTTVAATAMGGTDNRAADGNDGTPPPSAVDAPMIERLSPDQASSFAVLRQSKREDDDPGTGPRGPFGANLTLARKVETPAGAAWVVPANGFMCLRTQDEISTAWTCTTTADAQAGRLIFSKRSGDAKAVESLKALVPDGASSVKTVTAKDARAASVTDNVVAETDRDVTAVTFTDQDGKAESHRVP